MNSWSYSRLSVFEKCPKQYYYSSIKKIQTPQHPAAQRGTKIHDAAERYIKGEEDVLPKELSLFQDAFEDLQRMHKEGTCVVEEDWAFDTEWQPTGWFDENTWGRYKIDAYVKKGNKTVVIDFKTGRYAGNESSHEAQCALYAAATAYKFPEATDIQAELWYLDHGRITRHSYTTQQLDARRKNFHARAMKLSTATEYETTPSSYACRWCYFGKEGICRDVFRN